MTLDGAIRHAEEVAKAQMARADALDEIPLFGMDEDDGKQIEACYKCAEEHRQLAEWLRDYKRLLEQEPSVSENPNNCDLISRGEVLENAFKIYTHECGLLEVVGVATIETLPSVKPQTGHWIIMGDRYIKCSECGHITKTESPDIYNFCMVCGANMSENPTSSKPEISSFYGLKFYVRERSE